MNVGKQQVIILAPHRLDHVLGGYAGSTIHPVTLQHFLYHIQQHRVVINDKYIPRQMCRMWNYQVLALYRFIRGFQWKCNTERATLVNAARHVYCPAKQVAKTFCYRQAQSETLRVSDGTQSFKRAEDT